MTVTEAPFSTLVAQDESDVIKIGDARYELSTRTLLIDGQAATMEPRIGDLLVYLARADGPVTREALLDDIWGVLGSDEALTQAISKLRRALNDTSRPHRIIQTVPKQGYRLGVQANIRPAASETAAFRSYSRRVIDFVDRNRVFLSGFAAGVAFSILLAASFVLANPPGRSEIEVLCSEANAPVKCDLEYD